MINRHFMGLGRCLPKLRISFMALLGLGSFADLRSQPPTTPGLYLSNYTFGENNLRIGSIHALNEESLGNYVLKGKSRKTFYLVGNELFIKKLANDKSKWYEIIVQRIGTPVTDTFRIVKDEFADNKVIAHRGAWQEINAPHNSIASLKQAITLGCAGSEFDVCMSADSIAFVNHDSHFQDVQIDKSPASHLQTMQLANGEQLPTLTSFFNEGMKQNATKLVLEIKPHGISKEWIMALTTKVVQQVRQQKMQAWIIYISFDYDVIKKVLELDPSAKVQYLNGDKAPLELAKDGIRGIDYHFEVLKKHQQWIKEAQANKCIVNSWTVNDETVMKWLIDREVDYITTDKPELLLQKINTK